MVAEAQGADDVMDPEALDRTRATMHRRLQMMPRFLGIPMIGATLVFDWGGVLASGLPFHRQSAAQRRKQLETWRKSSIGFLVNFVDFYEKMAKFTYFYELHERKEQRDEEVSG